MGRSSEDCECLNGGKKKGKKKETKGEEGVRRNYIHTLLYEKSVLVECEVD